MKPAINEARMSVETRLAVVETALLNINSTLHDLKQDMKRGFDRIDSKFDAMDRKFEAKFDGMDSKFETRFETKDKKFEALDKKFDARCDRLENRLWSNFLWLMGMIIGLAGLVAHTQHWI